MTTSTTVTSYGTAALEHLRDTVSRAKATDPMAAVTLIVPNNIAGIVARRHLARGTAGRAGIAGIEITTLVRLAGRIAAPALAPRRPTTRAVLAAAWRSALAHDPGLFGDVAEHPATVRALVRAHGELRDIDDAARATVGETSPLCADLLRLHDRVRAALGAGWYDDTDVLTTAGAHLSSAGLGDCVLYLPQDLNQSETAFLAALARHTELSVIGGLTGEPKADRDVAGLLDTLGGAVEHPSPTSTASIVINSSDSDDEIRCVVRDLMSTLAATPAHRVAVLHTQAIPYARLLHEQLRAAGVRVNGPGYRAVDERAVGRFLSQLLALDESDLPRAELFQVLSGVPSRSFDGERIPIARWERVSRAAGVVGGDDWDRRLGTYVADQNRQRADEQSRDDPRDWLVRRCEEHAATAEQLRGFATNLREQLRRGNRLDTWAELSAWALDVFTTLIGEPEELRTLPAEEQYAATAVVSILRSLATVDGIDVPPTLGGLRDVLDSELAAARARVGRFGDGVFVGPVSASIGLDLDVVYVVGVSEDLYPGRLHRDALLPDRARRATHGALPDQRAALNRQHRHLLAAFASAERVVVSFARGDLRRSSKRLPSRWLLPSLRRLCGDDTVAATEWDRPTDYADAVRSAGSFAGELIRCVSPATDQEWRVRQIAATGTLEDPVATDGIALLDARASHSFTRFDGNLAGVEGLPRYATEDRVVSPTALESYAECPHSFLVRRLLGVTPLELPEKIEVIAPSEIGNLVHECVDALVTECSDRLPGPGEPWTPAQHARLLQIVAERAIHYEERGLTGHRRLWAPERDRISRDSARLLADDDSWRADYGVAIIASELSFGTNGTPPVTVEIAEGTVSFRGSADLVGRAHDGALVVIDIKTGSPRPFQDIPRSESFCGATKLQLPVYAHAARQRFAQPTTPVAASYWFVRRNLERVAIDLTTELEQRYAETLSTLVRSIAAGLFPAKSPEEPDYGWVRCAYCNPDGIGHADNRKRWERKRHDPVLGELVALLEPKTEGEAP